MISPEESQSLEKLIREVGALLKEYWPGDPYSQKGKQLTIYDKPDGSKVTDADLAANEILVAGLRKLFPKDAVVSEEGPKDEGHQTMSRVWIVDPVDGTKEFTLGIPEFVVSVALVREGRPVLGVLYNRLVVGSLWVVDRLTRLPREAPAAAIGAWAGKTNQIAVRIADAWEYHVPKIGWLCFIEDEAKLSAYKSTGWSAGLAI